jgi:hypothetical protein
MKTSLAKPCEYRRNIFPILLLLVLLAILFWRSFLPDYVHFSNDGPLGQENVDWAKLPAAWTGMWDNLNDTGYNTGSFIPSLSALILWLLQPVGFAKFYAMVALFILGVGAWTFFRALKLSSMAVTLGIFAAVLNSTFFADACWGTASHQIALGMDFFALALIFVNVSETSVIVYWSRVALAGLCVGVNVMEAVDIGGLYSILIAVFVFYKSVVESEEAATKRIIRGISQVAVVSIFAGFIAFQTAISMFGIVGTSTQGATATTQNSETKGQHWDYATQWSLPKRETLELVVPGLFGYKMDTPKDMMPLVHDFYRNGVYWGGIGRDPATDRFFYAGGQGTPPSGFMRFTDGVYYCGILVILIAGWAIAQSSRRQNSPFTIVERRIVWFWAVVLFATLLFSWGRFAPMFYGILYKLPLFSKFFYSIRNPTKFLFLFSWALVIIFAYGVHALSSRYLAETKEKTSHLYDHLRFWFAKTGDFDRKWILICVGILGGSLLGWLIYASQKPALVDYLQKVGFPGTDPGQDNSAAAIAGFSIRQVGWFVLMFGVALGLLALTLSGYFSGPRAKWGVALLGTFLVFDLVRADLPYVVHWDYKQKYEVGSLNPIIEFLRKEPYEHRVAGLPFHPPQGLELFDELYRIEWMQHHFPYYNIQCLDLIQMSRMPENMKAYIENFFPHTESEAPLFARRWQLTNTRYLLGPAGFLDVMNRQFDPVQQRFHILQRFNVVPKSGILQPTRLEELTAFPNDNGDYALFEFAGALPRVKLYSNWQVNTNDNEVLKTLADLNFDPANTVLVDTPQADFPPAATLENSGSADFKSYAPEKVVISATAPAPSILLLNDQYENHWSVTVDGKPAPLLRCNYLMRGVSLTPGLHSVTFSFAIPNKASYITLAAIVVALALGVFLLVQCRNGKQKNI